MKKSNLAKFLCILIVLCLILVGCRDTTSEVSIGDIKVTQQRSLRCRYPMPARHSRQPLELLSRRQRVSRRDP